MMKSQVLFVALARVLVGSISTGSISTGSISIGSLFATSAMAEPRAVIELFTSQGCSSCPPADKLLAELRNDSSLVTLTLAIDYWDYLGWKDTLAMPGHATRQKAYSQTRGDREVYTPQVVVNGVAQALGSDHGEIEKAVEESRQNAAALSIPVQVSIANDRLTVTLPDGNAGGAADVWLCPLSRSVTVGVGRGENRGRTLTYTNVVRRWVKLGTWSGKSENFTVSVDSIRFTGIDAVAVMVQAGSAEKPGAMLGATLASLR
jgi:hypothetical protein